MKPSSKYLSLFIVAVLIGAAGVKGYEYFYPEKEDVKTINKPTSNQEEKKVINEIKTNEPNKTTTTQTPAPSKAVSPDQELIASYYNKLSQGDYQGAYDMKKYKRMDFSVFKNLYTNLKSTKFLDFIEVAPNQYDFIIELTNKDDSKENYHVWMQVEGNQLNSISSNSTDESPALRFVYGEDGDVITLFLVQNGKTTKIDTAKHSKGEEFNNVEIIHGNVDDKDFSEGYQGYSADVLIYWKTSGESNLGKLYDIKKNQVVHDIGTTREMYGFSNDMQWFYNCAVQNGEIKVYRENSRSFRLQKDLSLPGYSLSSCDGYNHDHNQLEYTLLSKDSPFPHHFIYDISSDWAHEKNDTGPNF